MDKVLEIKNLKKYFGKVKAVDGITFSIEKGELLGFLGPNGAGKSTTIKCIMDFERPTAGLIRVFGLDSEYDSPALKSKIGYLPGEVNLYEKWTGKEHIDFIESIKGKSVIVNDLIKRFEFNPKVKVKNLSSGNKQKLGIILALMNEPHILILDEPTNGLDPLLQNTFYQIIQEFKERGKTILMSSHNLAEVEKICDRVAIIRAGKLVSIESIEKIRQKKMHIVDVTFDGQYKKSDFKLDEIAEAGENRLVLKIKGGLDEITKTLSKYKMKDLEITHASLEDIFLEFYGRKGR